MKPRRDFVFRRAGSDFLKRGPWMMTEDEIEAALERLIARAEVWDAARLGRLFAEIEALGEAPAGGPSRPERFLEAARSHVLYGAWPAVLSRSEAARYVGLSVPDF